MGGGIINDDCTTVNYLTIVEDSVNDNYGEFLLHPDVTVNNHPLGSVQFISKSFYKDNTQYQWERFSIPTRSTLDSIESDIPGLSTNIQIFENNAWVNLGHLQTGVDFANIARLNNPFQTINLLAFKATPGAVYILTGELFGNSNIEFNERYTWNSHINSCTGKIKTHVLLNCLNEGMKLWDRINNIQITENNVTQYPYIYPINGEIFLKNSTTQSIIQNLSYKDLVWDPSFDEEVAQASYSSRMFTMTKPAEINSELEVNGIFSNPEPVF